MSNDKVQFGFGIMRRLERELAKKSDMPPTAFEFGTAKLASNRDSLRKHDNAALVAIAPALIDIEILRKAARLLHADPTSTNTRLGAEARAALVADGIEPVDDLITEVTSGMGA